MSSINESLRCVHLQIGLCCVVNLRYSTATTCAPYAFLIRSVRFSQDLSRLRAKPLPSGRGWI